ncbi:histidine kinase [Rufibacter sp. DG15C]|uniref:sensor histidine kinase n=1 Tax=Rufibacter sp. DG15C TaxID=1379909 RepID=UPI00078BFC72|nr:HAMP domain-containing sensor histidine kinase [Rufibacter sp. DG15C]AMM51697.1 histidine kinase [Rufibacter sp. DG15C]
MKLLNHVTAYFAAILLVVLTAWAGIFYYNMLDEIYDSIDDGLENQKILVMQKARQDSTVLQQTDFEEGYYKIRPVTAAWAQQHKDLYQDTLMYMQNEKDYEPVRLLTTVFGQGGRYYEMRLITSMVEEDDLIEDLLYSLLWLYLGLLATLLLLNNILLKRIWKPFYTLLARIKKFRLDGSQPFTSPKSNIEEFALLGQTVEKLLQKNLTVYQSQKSFIENASHELQTPLAISLNKLELLAESPNLQERELEQIGGILQNLERLTRLNKSLLLLSKIENRQFAEEGEVNLKETVQSVLQDFEDQLEYKYLSVEEELEDCPVTMNPDLANMLVVNLVKNALVHNVPGGFVHVRLTATSLTMENSGPDAALDPDQLFLRFYKGSTANTSTGLGLAVVKAICDLYGFTVRYQFEQKHMLHISFK